MLAGDDLGTRVLLMFLPGSGALPEMKFFSQDCTLWLALPGFRFPNLGAAEARLLGRCAAHGGVNWQGFRRRARLGSRHSSSTDWLGKVFSFYGLRLPLGLLEG